MTAAHRDERVIGFGTEVLEHIKDTCRSLVYAAVLTDDGFEVVSLASARVAGSRMASMSSSMQALGDAVARELQLGTSEYIIIATPGGYVIQLRVPSQTLVMSAMFGNSETLGKALAVSRQAANRLAALIDPTSTPTQ
jgi:predicted regulator of Ras-like GTPase activity (Roadblock/LC7/MglB family)